MIHTGIFSERREAPPYGVKKSMTVSNEIYRHLYVHPKVMAVIRKKKDTV